MEPETEDQEQSGNLASWSGSDGSQEIYVSGSVVESHNEDEVSEAEYPLEPESTYISKYDPDSPEHLQEWESAGEQQSPPELSGSEEEVSYQEEDDIYLSESRESPHIQTSQTSLHPECTDSEDHAGKISRPHSQSSFSSLGCAADMTMALTLTTGQLTGASNRKGPETGNSKLESSEEGGSSEAPPASVSFGISDEGAEQAEKWNSESDTDLCRPDRQRAKYTRLSRSESQSERHIKETKSKCKRIARLLTDAPNPQNKGALLFKKRRQRVKKFTLVSYGTGDNKVDSEDQIEAGAEEVRSAGYNFVATSDSELEEQYSLYQHQHNLSLNWGSVQEMDALPETKGKGVLMFAQRRKRIDEIVTEHEKLRSEGLPVEVLTEPDCEQAQQIYDTEEMYAHADQADQSYMNANLKQHGEYQEDFQDMNHLSNVPKPLVPNRTARPFLGFQDSPSSTPIPGSVVPVTKKHETRFKVPVPINTNPQVWSPTGDIIASRDERISVPAIKTGILPESKQKATNKQSSVRAQYSDLHTQNKGERRSYIDSEEDCFSLGAEACNFMQPRTIKLKNPPPVAPKPTLNPNCPPWMRRSPSSEPNIPPRSPVSQPSHSPVGPHSQNYLQQQDWAQLQQMANRWAPDQTQATLQTPTNAWAPDNRGTSWAGDGPAMTGKGAELFAKRQSRMEKFIVDAETVQANKIRSPSLTSSLPNSWRYSSNIRAPPPLSYNPLLSPFYAAAKQPPSTSPKVNVKTKEKSKSAPKQLNSLDIMKHQPYQLNSSLFKYNVVPGTKSPTPSPTPSPKPAPVSKFEVTKNLKLRVASHTAAPAAHRLTKKPAHSARPASTSSQQPSAADSIASAFSPASLIARGARQLAPWPKFSAKKPVVTSKHWKPVAIRSLSLPQRLSSMPSPGHLSPVSTPGVLPIQRQTSFQEKVCKPLTPWEAASRSPIGSVDEAFLFLPSSAATNAKAAKHRGSLPEPPEEWKRRVSLDPAPVSKSHYHHEAPAFHILTKSRTFSPEKPAFYGPPFRPAQPLRASIGQMAQGFSPTKCSPVYSAFQRS
uniref:Synaptopodin-2-like n=1 Tax=Pundamilia nyererei TaxID=303518 RepID=A0A3B4FNI7_9CICH